jgi:hypothetical protein
VPLGRLRYATLSALLRAELVCEEPPQTAALIRALAGVCRRGRFTRAEFRRMCRWKSPRARGLWEANSAARIRAVSRAVLTTGNERRRMELLTSLHGVGVPVASAILTLIDPRRYGVLDIRAWQLLVATGAVTTNPRGQSFTIGEWEQYLSTLRRHARRLGVTARTIEYTLFECHRKHQRQTLYGLSQHRRGGARWATRPRGGERARGLP